MKLDDPVIAADGCKLDAKTANAFRGVVQQSFAQLLPTVDKMPGIEATMFLLAEGNAA